jgi:hypothetical protein
VAPALAGAPGDGVPGDLLRAVVQRCQRARRPGREYVDSIFFGGLANKHRDVLRNVAQRRAVPPSPERDVLLEAGMIEREGEMDRYHVADPLLELHLTPLRVQTAPDAPIDAPQSAPQSAVQSAVQSADDHAVTPPERRA